MDMDGENKMGNEGQWCWDEVFENENERNKGGNKMGNKEQVLWDKVFELEREVVSLKRKLKETTEERDNAKGMELYYHGKYESLLELKNFLKVEAK